MLNLLKLLSYKFRLPALKNLKRMFETYKENWKASSRSGILSLLCIFTSLLQIIENNDCNITVFIKIKTTQYLIAVVDFQ